MYKDGWNLLHFIIILLSNLNLEAGISSGQDGGEA